MIIRHAITRLGRRRRTVLACVVAIGIICLTFELILISQQHQEPNKVRLDLLSPEYYKVDPFERVHDLGRWPGGNRSNNPQKTLARSPVPASRTGDETLQRIRSMASHAWRSYVNAAIGQNEYRPVSRIGHNPDMFGHGATLAISLIDSLDTLLILGLDEEYRQGINWLRANPIDFDHVEGMVNVFEVNIRMLGGLLGAYTLAPQSDRAMLLSLAKQLGDRLLPAFNSKHGIALSLVNLNNGKSTHHMWSPAAIILSEAGSLNVEFEYLSMLTGDDRYARKARHCTQRLIEATNDKLSDYISDDTQRARGVDISMGALGDSFYEYLLKLTLLSKGKPFAGEDLDKDYPFSAFITALENAERKILRQTATGTMYFGEWRYDAFKPIMGHLACFAGGMYALAKMSGVARNESMAQHFEKVAFDVTDICRSSYVRGNGLGPESFMVNNDGSVDLSGISYYILRPEYVESLFYLHRMTKNEKYRRWGLDFLDNLEKRCRVDGGYSGLTNVAMEDATRDDLQQSFFLAETVKYLYLLFSDDTSLIPLDKYILTTEAHVFLIGASKH